MLHRILVNGEIQSMVSNRQLLHRFDIFTVYDVTKKQLHIQHIKSDDRGILPRESQSNAIRKVYALHYIMKCHFIFRIIPSGNTTHQIIKIIPRNTRNNG